MQITKKQLQALKARIDAMNLTPITKEQIVEVVESALNVALNYEPEIGSVWKTTVGEITLLMRWDGLWVLGGSRRNNNGVVHPLNLFSNNPQTTEQMKQWLEDYDAVKIGKMVYKQNDTNE